MTISSAPSLRRKSGVSTSIVVCLLRLRISWITRTNCMAPPSSRSSRSTEVTTTCARPSLAQASATCSGSCGSSWSGRPVATLQKAQARVQREPRIITVACFCFQHSPMFGQAASSQTVLSPSWRISALVSAYSVEVGALTRIQSGLRRIGVSGRWALSGWRSNAVFSVISLTYWRRPGDAGPSTEHFLRAHAGRPLFHRPAHESEHPEHDEVNDRNEHHQHPPPRITRFLDDLDVGDHHNRCEDDEDDER